MLISRTCLLAAFAVAPADPPGTATHASAASTLTMVGTMTFFRNALFTGTSLSVNSSFTRASRMQHGPPYHLPGPWDQGIATTMDHLVAAVPSWNVRRGSVKVG